MKGMQKIKRGKNFAGVVLYALQPDSHHKIDPVVIGGNMMGSLARELIAEFGATKTLRPDVAKAVWHNSLRLPKNEALTNSEWAIIADDYMTRMGFSETHLRCYVLHDDKDGQHIHIIASRVSLDAGKLYLGRNENLASTRIIQQLERDYNLTRTKGPEAKASLASPSRNSATQKPITRTTAKPKKCSRNESMMEKRTGEICPKTVIQEAIDTLIQTKITEEKFVQQLAAQKIKALPNRASTGKMNGFSFKYANISFKASQLGKKYSWKNLEPFIIIDSPTIVNRKTETSSFFVGIDMEDIQLASPEAVSFVVDDKTRGKSYVDVAMRWIETIPWVDKIVNTVKKLRNPLLRAFKQPPKIFSASPLSIDLPSLPSVEKPVKTNIFRLKI
ncbi:relaxase/mobilization nuclease domain-containing protein [Enterobacter bugandensis]|uniref:relaxase/mobilization nuclease domain-containing protein n=1 Tax=Enterobacter bugandensis TaxID=881260 RepID=UPI0029D8A1CB|nr:relaxase/mobilization nuclease domain-containing protein [Enterobacter bugandensis]MDX7475469.1 relaxase/mobilization nuclease domain-containing protein [Enterobacter bugandensis]